MSVRDGWLPLVEYAHLPLPHFANCYSTATCGVEGPGGVVAQQVFVASAHEVHAIRYGPPSSDHTSGSRSATSSSGGSNHSIVWLEPLALARLPAGSEVIGVDAFNAGDDGRPVVCVAVGLLTPPAAQTTEGHRAKVAVPTRFVLNIYGLSTPASSSCSDFTALSQDCLSIRLPFVPFRLTHSQLFSGCTNATTRHQLQRSSSTTAATAAPDIILAGSDRNVHVYRYSGLAYTELPLNTSHPLAMLQGTASSVLAIDIVCTASSPRTFMVAGCQDGLVRFASLTNNRRSRRQRRSSTTTEAAEEDEATPTGGAGEDDRDEESAGSPWQLGDDADGEAEEDLWSDFYLDGPVSSASFFSPSAAFLRDVFRTQTQAEEPLNDHMLNRMQRRAFDACVATESPSAQRHHPHADTTDERIRPRSASETLMPEVRLLMTNAVGFGTVYSGLDAGSLSFSTGCYLTGSGCHSSSDFSSLVDPSSDSVLSSGALDLNMDGRNEVLLGTYSSQMLVFQETFDGVTDPAADHTADEGASSASATDYMEGYALAARKQFAFPVYSMVGVDLHGSGLDELVVTTQHSVSILSWEVESAVDVLTNKLECVEEIRQLEIALHRMKQQQQQQQATETRDKQQTNTPKPEGPTEGEAATGGMEPSPIALL